MDATKQSDLMLIRHAQSLMNEATENYVNTHQIVYDWQHLSKDMKFLTTIKYNAQLLDATITKKGAGECQVAKKSLREYKPDVILVSPLNRALTTCSKIFANESCPVIVEPILAQGLRSSCDFSSELSKKKVQFSSYNFENVQKEGQFWFINNQSEENQNQYKQIIEQNKHLTYPEIMRQIFVNMTKTFIYETPTNLRRRTQKLKELLKRYRQKYNKIAIVSHYNIIRFILAKEFNEKDEPYHCHIGNCQIITTNVSNL